jgi:hypothetical protein
MDWWHIMMPVSGVEISWPGLVLLGLGVGLISGFFGMGGGWMVTPGLNILGFPMAFAIGTGVTQMAGPSLVSTVRHSKFGNVDYKLGLIMVAGTVSGFEPGARLVMCGWNAAGRWTSTSNTDIWRYWRSSPGWCLQTSSRSGARISRRSPPEARPMPCPPESNGTRRCIR